VVPKAAAVNMQAVIVSDMEVAVMLGEDTAAGSGTRADMGDMAGVVTMAMALAGSVDMADMADA